MKEAVQNLEKWYRKAARPLPWRETQDPYRIWVSEVMLQQTQVATVLGYYERFLKAFPTLAHLAKAKEEDVLRLWSGLGYYSRARNLQKGAQFILQNHRAEFPQTREEILKVPGIGPYTAGAILSIAFNLKEPLVDGNVLRVFSRFLGYKKCIDVPKHHRFFWETAEAWVKESQSPRFFNQSLMELGATVCTKAAPKCPTCPLRLGCIAFERNLQMKLPVRKPRRATEELQWTLFVHEKEGKIFLKQNPPGGWWEGLWDLPRVEKLMKVKGTPLSKQVHTVTHHRIHATAFHLPKKAPSEKEGRWVLRSEILDWPLSSLSRKVLQSLEI